MDSGHLSLLADPRKPIYQDIFSSIKDLRKSVYGLDISFNKFTSLNKDLDEIEDKFRNMIRSILSGSEIIEVLKIKATVDPKIPILLNSREFIERSFNVLRNLKPFQTSAYLLIDVRGFKKINDSYGHFVGDKVLENIANLMNQHLRSNRQVKNEEDLKARFGGDEFAAFLVDLPSSDTARDIAQRFCSAIHGFDWQAIDSRIMDPVKVDMGMVVISFNNPLQDPKSFIQRISVRADELMYVHKCMSWLEDPPEIPFEIISV